MFKAVLIQAGASFIVAVIAGVLVGVPGAISAALGGAASTLPNFLFALRLKAAARRPGASYALNFFLGEFVKVAATVGLLVVAVKTYGEVHWPSLLIGLAVALQAGFLAFWTRSKNG